MTLFPNPDEDPGWPRGLSALVFLVPGALQRQARKQGVDGLCLLRQVMESFSLALVLVGVVLVFMKTKGGDVFPWLVILVAVAILSVVISRRCERPLDCASAKGLAGSYRSRFFLRFAFAESVALVAFVFAFSGGPK